MKHPVLSVSLVSARGSIKILESPSPSLAGQTVIDDQAVLLAPGHRVPAPSQRCFAISSDILAGTLADTVAGPRRLKPAFLLSLATPDPSL